MEIKNETHSFNAGKQFFIRPRADEAVQLHADRAAGKQNLSSMCFAVALPQKTIKKNAL